MAGDVIFYDRGGFFYYYPDCPMTIVPHSWDSKKALKIHPYKFMPFSCRATSGPMVVTAKLSNATVVTANMMPMVSDR